MMFSFFRYPFYILKYDGNNRLAEFDNTARHPHQAGLQTMERRHRRRRIKMAFRRAGSRFYRFYGLQLFARQLGFHRYERSFTGE